MEERVGLETSATETSWKFNFDSRSLSWDQTTSTTFQTAQEPKQHTKANLIKGYIKFFFSFISSNDSKPHLYLHEISNALQEIERAWLSQGSVLSKYTALVSMQDSPITCALSTNTVRASRQIQSVPVYKCTSHDWLRRKMQPGTLEWIEDKVTNGKFGRNTNPSSLRYKFNRKEDTSKNPHGCFL